VLTLDYLERAGSGARDRWSPPGSEHEPRLAMFSRPSTAAPSPLTDASVGPRPVPRLTFRQQVRLLDRHEEVQILEGLIACARRRASGALVVQGEPGIGKTALLDLVAASALDLRIARVAGVEAEMELSHAGLYQLLAPFLPDIAHLPRPQRRALQCAFRLVDGVEPDRFLLALAVQALLTEIAARQPLLCVVDDVQWLDRESSDVLAFIARRLDIGGVALLFALEEPVEFAAMFAGVPHLRLGGLPDVEARELLESSVVGPLANEVRDRIVAEARGNPLALLELSGGLTPEQLDGSSPLIEPLACGSHLEARLLRKVRSLPKEAQTLLLLAAAEPSGDPALVWRAASDLGLGAATTAMSEVERFISVDKEVTFRHPLIRSAVYHGVSGLERRQAHQALAAASDPEVDADRRAWHLAAGVLGTDEAAAAELERSAGRARRRGGYSAAAAYLSRAADLTPDRARKVERTLAAAEFQLEAGAPYRGLALLERATGHVSEPRQLAAAGRLRGAIYNAIGETARTPALLLEVARSVTLLDARLAREALLEALASTIWTGRFGDGVDERAVAAATLASPRPPQAQTTATDLLLDGFAQLVADGHQTGLASLRQAVAALRARPAADDEQVSRWMGLAVLAAAEMCDDHAQRDLSSRWVALAREQGALMTLPLGLAALGVAEVSSGRFEAADACFTEASSIAATTGCQSLPAEVGDVLLRAWRGRESDARTHAAAVAREAAIRGNGAGLSLVQSALAILELGLGNYESAMTVAMDVFEDDPLCVGTLALPNLIEAAYRSGDRRTAARALKRLSRRARANGTPLALGLLARSEALLARDGDTERFHRVAISHLKRSSATTELARAHLLQGEWLRRCRRSRDARGHLRAAHEMFDSIGALAFAQRARTELRATGERARKRVPETRDDLTPQEVQIAALAAQGVTNTAIAAQLYISPSTVAYHLRKVFRKLDVTSRRQLGQGLSEWRREVQTRPAGPPDTPPDGCCRPTRTDVNVAHPLAFDSDLERRGLDGVEVVESVARAGSDQ
jgi:DNA-binding CsgD family transcriptional regulator